MPYRYSDYPSAISVTLNPYQPNPLLQEVEDRRELSYYRGRKPLGTASRRAAELYQLLPDPAAVFGLPTPKSDVDIKTLFVEPVYTGRTTLRHPLYSAPGSQKTRNYTNFDKDQIVFGLKSKGADRSGEQTRQSLQGVSNDPTKIPNSPVKASHSVNPERLLDTNPHRNGRSQHNGNILAWTQQTTNSTPVPQYVNPVHSAGLPANTDLVKGSWLIHTRVSRNGLNN